MGSKQINNITFSELVEKDIEPVRNWRNDKDINQYFLNKEYITSAQQQQWFNKINLNKERYYMVSYLEEKIGLFYLTNINKIEKTAEPNGFIGDKKLYNTPLAGKVLVAFFTFAFENLGFNILQGKILENNESFIKMHKQMGAKLTYESGLVKTELSQVHFMLFKNEYFS